MIYTHALDPIALDLGFIQIYWYGVMYALGFLAGYVFLSYAARKKQIDLTVAQIDLLVFAVAAGVIVGGRLGYFLFYQFDTLIAEPLKLLTIWKGGMSFHGGLLGVIIALALTARSFKKPLLQLSDLILIPAAFGLFLGRLGNWINGELWGRPTGGDWGVVFPRAGDDILRHPSQLYEAVKNLSIFGILLTLWHLPSRKPGLITFTFLTLYGFGRILVEGLWREPLDGYIWGLTTGQFWSVPVLLLGVGGLIYLLFSPLRAPRD